MKRWIEINGYCSVLLKSEIFSFKCEQSTCSHPPSSTALLKERGSKAGNSHFHKNFSFLRDTTVFCTRFKAFCRDVSGKKLNAYSKVGKSTKLKLWYKPACRFPSL